jgi:hypothetical protein
MKILEIRDAYYQASGKVSELVRQFSLAGIAVIWIFRIGGDDAGGVRYTSELLLPLGFFVAALGSDLLQYVYGSVIWGFLNTHHWRKHKSNDKDVKVSDKVNWPSLFFFWIKVVFALVAYGLLMRSIINQLTKNA